MSLLRMNSVSSRPGSLRRLVARALGREARVVDDVDRRLGGEVVAVVFLRPRAAVVNDAAGGRGEGADPDRSARRPAAPTASAGNAFRRRLDDFVARRVADLAAGERVFRQHGVHEQLCRWSAASTSRDCRR